jgi:hypothetical protein
MQLRLILLALVGLGTACDDHTHQTNHDHTRTAATSDTPELPTDLSPLRVEAAFVDGRVLPGGDDLVLIVDISPGQAAPKRTVEMVWFANRVKTGSPMNGSVLAVLAGQRVRKEQLVFAESEIKLNSTHSTTAPGFSVTGDVFWEQSGGFTVDITREIEERLRIHRTISGTRGKALLAGHSRLRTFRWSPETWSTSAQAHDQLMVGVPTPTEPVESAAGQWRSVTLDGTVRRFRWTLGPDRWARSAVKDGAPPLDEGSYTLSKEGELQVSSSRANDRLGQLNPALGSGFVFGAKPSGELQLGSYWWQHSEDSAQRAQAGDWRLVGRRPAKQGETGIITGTMALAADGSLTGELTWLDSSESVSFSGKLNPGSPTTGALQFAFPYPTSSTPSPSRPAAAAHSH